MSIENTYHLFSGTIGNLASHFQWLLQSLASMIASLGLAPALRQCVANLAERLIYGVDEDGVGLTRLRVEGLSRAYIQALIREGYNTPQSLAEAQVANLEQWIPTRVAQLLIQEAKALTKRAYQKDRVVTEPMIQTRPAVAGRPERMQVPHGIIPSQPKAVPKGRPTKPKKRAKPGQEPVTLEIDCNAPGTIVFCGKKVQLTRLPYKLLLLLASRPMVGIRYEDLDDSLWEDAKVERQQVSAHKSAIIKAFATIIGKRQASRLIKTHSGFGLSLQINPQDIHIIPICRDGS